MFLYLKYGDTNYTKHISLSLIDILSYVPVFYILDTNYTKHISLYLSDIISYVPLSWIWGHKLYKTHLLVSK